MSPVATLIILGIAAIAWFGFLRGHFSGKRRNSGESGGGGDGGGD
jgi:hypothetical protein